MEEIYLIERIDHCGLNEDGKEHIMITPEGFTKTKEAAENLRQRFDAEIEKKGPRYFVDGEKDHYPRFLVCNVRSLD